MLWAGGEGQPGPLFNLLRPRWVLGAAAPPPGVQRGSPGCTGPNRFSAAGPVHSALTCCRVSGPWHPAHPLPTPALCLGEPAGRHPGGESCMPSLVGGEAGGQGSIVECPRPLCSPKNTQPRLPWPFSSSVCVFVVDVAKHLPLEEKAPWPWKGWR